MKFKYGFLVIFVTCILLFTTCDFLNGDDNKENNNNGNNGNTTQTVIVEPLIQTKWSGGAPFNNMVPMDGENRSAAGCVAIAMAQIMNFHKYPAQGTGERETYTTNGGIIVPTVNFEDTHYDWVNMLKTYPDADSGTPQQRDAVATLVFHTGVGVRMDYSASSSSPIGLTALPLVNYFGYDRSIERHLRSFYDNDAAWETIIRTQLDNGLPVLYSGRNSSGGSHRFIIDGYDNEGKFHINYGYGGRNDGWYNLNDMTYRFNQIMHINIKPDKSIGNSEIMAVTTFPTGKTSVLQNELFIVTGQLTGVGFFSGGHFGTALVNNNGGIEAIVGAISVGSRSPGDTPSLNINCYVPETVNPGSYSLGIVSRPTDGDWKIVTLSDVGNGVPSTRNLTVTTGEANGGGYGLVLQAFSPEKTSVGQNENFTIDIRLINRNIERFSGGSFGAVLVDDTNEIVAHIGTRSYGGLGALSYSTGIITISDCSVPDTVDPGIYQLRIVVRTTGNEWRIATLAVDGIPTSIPFTVL
jgi:hypothetical protein